MDSMQMTIKYKAYPKIERNLCYVTSDNVLFSIESIAKQVLSYRDFESNGLL